MKNARTNYHEIQDGTGRAGSYRQKTHVLL